MPTGDQADMAARMRAVLPARWVGDEGTTPILDAVLAGLGNAWGYCYALLAFTRLQARLASSSGVFVDLWASSWFGSFPRLSAEADAAYIQRIQANLFLIRATRPSFVTAMIAATGRAPTQIIELMNANDTGGLGTLAAPAAGGGGGFDVGGIAYGSLVVPAQFFLTQSLGTSGDTPAQFYPVVQAALPAGVAAWTDLTT